MNEKELEALLEKFKEAKDLGENEFIAFCAELQTWRNANAILKHYMLEQRKKELQKLVENGNNGTAGQ